jgi:hypothetical protein
MEENENNRTIPKVDLVDKGNENEVNPLSKIAEETMTRREFLKKGALSMLALGAALAFGGCKPENAFGTESEKDNLEKNIQELNNQYLQHEREFGPFSYDRFKNQYSEFEQYIPFIDTASDYALRDYKVDSNAMRTIISSIIAANLNNWETKDPSKDPYYQRTGPMQLYPAHAQAAIKKMANDSKLYSPQQFEDPFFNIIMGKESILYALKNIKNDGTNKDIFSLVLAQYYDQTGKLINVVKNNLNIDDYSYLRSNYELYQKTLNILEGKESTDKSAEEILNKAVQYWPETNIKYAKEVFIQQADKYYNDENNTNPKLSRAELAALFVSVAMTESNGGIYKESQDSGALGWYQLVPQWRHLEDYNAVHGTNHTYGDLYYNDKTSIEVGIWTLMRYRDRMDILESLRFFKGGYTFGQNTDDGIWWNRVSYCTQKLLGRDALGMGYVDYFYNGISMSKEIFLQNPDHIGNVLVQESI